MPVVETEAPRAQRSALRYRPIPGVLSADVRPAFPRASRIRPLYAKSSPDVRELSDPEEDDDRAKEKYASQPMGSQVGRRPRPHRTPVSRRRWRLHPLFFLGVGLLLTLPLWILLTQALTWGTNALNTVRYGFPRAFQTDAVVGYNDSAGHPSHFLALNLNGTVEVIEWPGGDAAHARIYVGPQLFGPGSDQQPVTLRFADVNGDGRPDMLIEVQGSQIVWINDQGSFRPLKPGEQYTG